MCESKSTEPKELAGEVERRDRLREAIAKELKAAFRETIRVRLLEEGGDR